MVSPFLDVVIGNREEIEGVLDKFLVLLRSVLQEVPARAIDYADVPVRQTYFALCFGFHKKGEVESKRVRHGWYGDDNVIAQNLSHGM